MENELKKIFSKFHNQEIGAFALEEAVVLFIATNYNTKPKSVILDVQTGKHGSKSIIK